METGRVLYGTAGADFLEVAAVFWRRQVPLTLQQARSADELLERLGIGRYAAVLVDRELPPLGGLYAVQLVLEHAYPAPLVMLSERGDRLAAESVLRAGAVDFVVRRPGYAEAMPRILAKALEAYRLRRLTEDAAKRQAELDVLLALQRQLCGGGDLREAFELLRNRLHTACTYDRMVIWLLEGAPTGAARPAHVAARVPGLEPMSVQSLVGTLAGRALEQRRALAGFATEATLHPAGRPAAIAAPLFSDGEAIGVLEIARARPAYEEPAVRFLAAVAEQISSTLALAGRRRQEAEDRQRRERHRAQRDLSLRIADQLTQPLTIMLGYIELLRSRPLPSETTDLYWDRIHRAGEDLARRLREISRGAGAAATPINSGGAEAPPG